MAVGFRDYYDTLGVPRGAGGEDIRRAYRKLARENHPDVNKDPGAEDRFKEISEAYEVLRDDDKRKAYDRFGQNWKAGQDVSGAEGFSGGPRGARGARGAGGGRGAYEGFGGGEGVRVEFGDDDDFSDFFEGLFGGRGRRSRGFEGFEGFERGPRRGGDHEAVLELSLEEAAAGGTRHITLGDGRDYEVRIPAGVRDGQLIRLAGQGGAGAGGGPDGDLLLRVKLKPHPRFRVDGRDLHTDLPVAPWEAALGAEVDIPTLTGRAKVKVPAGSSSGRRMRLRGEGLGGGDLYAAVKIMVPKRLSGEERELFEELAEVSSFDPRAGT